MIKTLKKNLVDKNVSENLERQNYNQNLPI